MVPKCNSAEGAIVAIRRMREMGMGCLSGLKLLTPGERSSGWIGLVPLIDDYAEVAESFDGGFDVAADGWTG